MERAIDAEVRSAGADLPVRCLRCLMVFQVPEPLPHCPFCDKPWEVALLMGGWPEAPAIEENPPKVKKKFADDDRRLLAAIFGVLYFVTFSVILASVSIAALLIGHTAIAFGLGVVAIVHVVYAVIYIRALLEALR